MSSEGAPIGILVADKPLGATSHDVVAKLRRLLGTRRVGHAGTLDPLATGVLVVAIGPATRFLQYLALEPKEYVARVRFGIATASYDGEGEVVREAPVPDDLAERVRSALPGLTGLQEQLPPLFSAVKVNGKPLYRYARAGQEVERRPRTIHVGEFERIANPEAGPDEMSFRVVCSGGTYVRTLAHDLGERVGCGAHLAALRRTRVGIYGLDAAIPVAEASPARLLPLERALSHLPNRTLTAEEAEAVRFGRDLPLEGPQRGRHLVLLGPDGGAIGIAAVADGVAHPECVIPLSVEEEASA